MQKLSNFTGQARHGWEKMTPSAFGMGPRHDAMGPGAPSNLPTQPPHLNKRGIGAATAAAGPLAPHPPTLDAIVTLSFNVPFASNLGGPLADEILHASPGAAPRWTFPDGTDLATPPPPHKLPVHVRNEELLRQLCKALSDNAGGRLEATVTSSEPKPTPASQRLPRKGLVTNVCVSGDGDLVHQMRAKILNETPIALVRDPNRGNVGMEANPFVRSVRSSKSIPSTCSISVWTGSDPTSSST